MLLNKESHAILHEKNPFLDKHKVLFTVDIVISVYIILNINVGLQKIFYLCISQLFWNQVK